MSEVPDRAQVTPVEGTPATKHKHALEIRSGDEWNSQGRSSSLTLDLPR